jgi:hypothetical protein
MEDAEGEGGKPSGKLNRREREEGANRGADLGGSEGAKGGDERGEGWTRTNRKVV